MFNLIGFWSHAWGLVYWVDPEAFLRWDSYLGRAIGLSALELFQTFLSVFIAVGSGFVLALFYYVVLRIGGMNQ